MIREAAAIVKKETQQRLYFLRILKKVHLLLEQLLSNNYHWTPSLFYCILLIRVYQSKLNAADCTRKQQNISNELQKLQTEVFFKYFYSKYCKTTQMYLKWAIKGSNSCIPAEILNIFAQSFKYLLSLVFLHFSFPITADTVRRQMHKILTDFISANWKKQRQTDRPRAGSCSERRREESCRARADRALYTAKKAPDRQKCSRPTTDRLFPRPTTAHGPPLPWPTISPTDQLHVVFPT